MGDQNPNAGKGPKAQQQQQQPPKIKFEIWVNGYKYVTVNNPNEPVDDIVKSLEKRAKKIRHIGEEDSIERLQFKSADDLEVSEMGLDLTAGDMKQLLENKKIVALISTPPPQPLPPPAPQPPPPPPSLGPTPPKMPCWDWCWK
ncbi:hypothetical protein CBR_g48165 [Chara braunii]|uniref:Ubiquitin-like domain-containing protein n=1 Tax=Chara braunii TaxID=69332 RepID=A0A388M241_CHABU|nr:hypothetical protein CBR_g48165 [Chara braunii]|eukprot:GBG88634.1 hypothetical protein CBR_g48165 [Chara braunii]